MRTVFRHVLLCLPWVSLALSGQALADGACPDDGVARPECTKEIRIWNNTSTKLYVVLQAGRQAHEAINCSVGTDGGGDVWLQRALGDTTKCYRVHNDYHVYVNPDAGIPPNSYVSVSLPWWSKRRPGSNDVYIDWWRGGRAVIFDDKAALDETYLKLKKTTEVQFAGKSPKPACTDSVDNTCRKAQLQIYQVTDDAQIAQSTPFQLTEFTFASIAPLSEGGAFVNFNQNYNVSNVDQLYLPVAIEPVRAPADVPYMGTTMSVDDFRERLRTFTGANKAFRNPKKWPIYNNPKINGKAMFPKAGIRVPSTLAVFNYYMNPSSINGEPEMVPATPPAVIQRMMDLWTACTTGGPCPRNDRSVYEELNAEFVKNYGDYISQCTPPAFLAPVPNSNPPVPPLSAFLRYVHGWVPFNNACPGVPELPTVAGGSRMPIDYIDLQYNYRDQRPIHWFNPYTQFVHAPADQGGLAANAYAFSIDDQSSFQTNSGGSLPGGLIIAIGGENGLVNKTQMPPPVPAYYPPFAFGLSMGPPQEGGARWAKYGVCSETADVEFPPDPIGAYAIGIDPKLRKISPDKPCTLTLMDTKGRVYQVTVHKAAVPPKPIWPPFAGGGSHGNLDPDIVSCPSKAGVVPPAQWCNFVVETAAPPSTYTLATRGPLP